MPSAPALPFARAALAEAADANFAVHAAWVPARTTGMLARVDDALVLADSGQPCDTFNFVCRARLAPADAARRVAGAVAHFRDAGRPFSRWVGPADRPRDLGARLEAAGLAPAESELAMARALAPLRDVPTPEGLTVVRAASREALDDFAAVSAENWSPPDPEVPRFYRRAAAALLADGCPQRLYVGYLGGVPVATAEATVADGVAGLYNVSTRAAYRRRGIGAALTTHALQDARAAGAHTGVLQASADGAGVYARLGFSAYGEFTEYKPAWGAR